jgi:hypothetical protein
MMGFLAKDEPSFEVTKDFSRSFVPARHLFDFARAEAYAILTVSL